MDSVSKTKLRQGKEKEKNNSECQRQQTSTSIVQLPVARVKGPAVVSGSGVAAVLYRKAPSWGHLLASGSIAGLGDELGSQIEGPLEAVPPKMVSLSEQRTALLRAGVLGLGHLQGVVT